MSSEIGGATISDDKKKWVAWLPMRPFTIEVVVKGERALSGAVQYFQDGSRNFSQEGVPTPMKSKNIMSEGSLNGPHSLNLSLTATIFCFKIVEIVAYNSCLASVLLIHNEIMMAKYLICC